VGRRRFKLATNSDRRRIMAHYAFLDENNIVTEVIVGKDEGEDGTDWEQWYGDFRSQVCKRTSYNTSGGVHNNNGTPYRYNYAGIGYTFDSTKGTDGAFIPPKPFASWILDENTCLWNSPVAYPEFDPENPKHYVWNEDTISWDEVTTGE
jgi:hypothetical protein